MSLIADPFPIFRAPKNVFISMSKRLCFRGPFDRHINKWVETLLQSKRGDLYHIY